MTNEEAHRHELWPQIEQEFGRLRARRGLIAAALAALGVGVGAGAGVAARKRGSAKAKRRR